MIEIGDDDMEENFDDEYDPDGLYAQPADLEDFIDELEDCTVEDTDDLIEDDDDDEENWPDFSNSWEMEESDDTEDDQEDSVDGPGTYTVCFPGGHEVIVHTKEEADELSKKAKQAELDAIKREHEELKHEIDAASAAAARRAARYMTPPPASTRKTKIVFDPSTGGTKKVSEAWPDKDDDGEKAEDPTLKMPELPKKHEWLVKKTEDSYDRSPIVNVILVKKSFFRKPERVAYEQIAAKGRSPKWVSEEIVRKAADIIARKFPEENPIDAYTIAGVHNVEGIKFH